MPFFVLPPPHSGRHDHVGCFGGVVSPGIGESTATLRCEVNISGSFVLLPRPTGPPENPSCQSCQNIAANKARVDTFLSAASRIKRHHHTGSNPAFPRQSRLRGNVFLASQKSSSSRPIVRISSLPMANNHHASSLLRCMREPWNRFVKRGGVVENEILQMIECSQAGARSWCPVEGSRPFILVCTSIQFYGCGRT